MRSKPTDMGTNRTGIGMSPLDSQLLIDVAIMTPPSSAGDQDSALALRAPYLDRPEPIGTMPPRGEKLTVLLDKLGERLAFERTGSRLYDALVRKFRELGADRTGPGLKQLVTIRDDERRHFDLVRRALEDLGADPTTQTPCADVQAVASSGLLQVVSDPRTTKAQCLSAILTAELADNAGWELLIGLCEMLGHKRLARGLAPALATEVRHLEDVKGWLVAYTRAEGGIRRPRRKAASRKRR
jgi:hypothetical protein